MTTIGRNLFSPPDSPAPFASDPDRSRGRLHPEQESPTRTVFQRDRDRIVHSGAFRRLKYKTQVFVYHEGDYYRTRLTHSIEVAQIARSICRVLGLNEDLAEALALAHDLGHTPFGHAGEEALNRCMADYGGFDHNAQSLRIVTRLEQRYIPFDGLNLTWETLEGLVKHNGPVIKGGSTEQDLPYALAEYAACHDLDLDSYAGAEAQVAALSDDIAYNNHDIDDGLRAGLFTIPDLEQVPLVGPVFIGLRRRHPGVDEGRLIHEAVRRLISIMVDDLLAETKRRLAEAGPRDVDEIRGLGRPAVAFSGEMSANDRALKDFLQVNMYRHYKVNRSTSKAKRVVTDLFGLFVDEPDVLPEEWRRACDGPGSPITARVVCDFIAGMTDRFAMAEHQRLFDLTMAP